MKIKTIYLVLLTSFSVISMSFAQVDVGLKGGISYNSNGDLSEITSGINNIISGADAKTGYNVGFWLNAKLPVLGIFIQPEINYVRTKSAYNSTNYSLQKLDIPVLFGFKILKFAKIYAGPSFQYVMDASFGLNTIQSMQTDDFSVGMNIGAGFEIGKLGFDVRYDRGLTASESTVFTNTAQVFNIDARQKQLVFGLTYKLN